MYDSNAQAVSNKLAETSTQVFNAATIEQILSLVSTPADTKVVVDTVTAANNTTITAGAGVEVLFVATSDTALTKVAVNGAAPVVFFQGAGGVDATVGTAAPTTAEGGSSAAVFAGVNIERVVVGTAGADTITIVDGKNTQVIAGDKDVVIAGTGQTVVVAAQGSSKVVGNDKTIVVTAGVEEDFAIVTANGQAKIVNTKTNLAVELTGVDFIQLDGTDALIFADNTEQATVANIYHAVLGRNADAAGLQYWYDVADAGASLVAIADGFLASVEYTADNQTNAQFIDSLYDNLLNRDGDVAGTAYWLAQMAQGQSRAQVVASFAQDVLSGIEVEVVGSVTIIDPIG